MCGERAETDDESWIDQRQFFVEPPTAFFYFIWIRAFVEAPFAALLVLKMLNGIDDVDCTTVKPGLFQSAIEDMASRPNEWAAFSVFRIARLFTNHHQPGICRALTEDSLGGMTIKRAALTARCPRPLRRKADPERTPRSSRFDPRQPAWVVEELTGAGDLERLAEKKLHRPLQAAAKLAQIAESFEAQGPPQAYAVIGLDLGNFHIDALRRQRLTV